MGGPGPWIPLWPRLWGEGAQARSQEFGKEDKNGLNSKKAKMKTKKMKTKKRSLLRFGPFFRPTLGEDQKKVFTQIEFVFLLKFYAQVSEGGPCHNFAY